MKICITALGNDLKSQLDPRFGRCSYILIIDAETQEVQAIENESTHAARGAGINTAQIVSDLGCPVVLTGNVGPKAFQALKAAGIKIFTAESNQTCEEILKNYNEDRLEEITANQPGGYGSGFGGSGGRHRRQGGY